MRSTLVPQLSGHFTTDARTRGLRYYNSGAVTILSGSPFSLSASVSGSIDYAVEIEWDARDLTFACTCPYFESEGLCKHLWASILAAQAHGYLSMVSNVRKIVLAELDFDYEPVFTLTPPPQIMKRDEPRANAAKTPTWKLQIGSLGRPKSEVRPEWPARREILYMVEGQSTIAAGSTVVSLMTRERKLNGTYNKPVALRLERDSVASLPRGEDREILAAVTGGTEYSGFGYHGHYGSVPRTVAMRQPLSRIVLPLMARTGRAFYRQAQTETEPQPLSWDDGGPWRFEIVMERGPNRSWLLKGILRRGDETMPVTEPDLLTKGGHVFSGGKVAPLDEDENADDAWEWLLLLRKSGAVAAPESDADELLATLLAAPSTPPLTIPEELRLEQVMIAPRPCLRVQPPDTRRGNQKLRAEVLFDYEGHLVPDTDPTGGVHLPAERRFLRRDPASERAALGQLDEAGLRLREPSYYDPHSRWELTPSKLPQAVTTLLTAGWHVEVAGKIFRRPGNLQLSVTSGLDWFELHGDVDYGPASARIPELLDALRRGETVVKLDDGTYGMVPEDLLRRFGMLAGMGTRADGHIRFRRAQAGLLDALLAAQPEATFDEAFARVRAELHDFRSVEAVPQPPGFVGQLRDYQREGLGWMDFLRRFSFGGCLADDMGVGKTAQVLAMLESRRGNTPHRPSLVVVPRSLMFNWMREAEQFTPQLRVLDHTGIGRDTTVFSDYDLILITYGTLRRDIATLKDIEFDYLVLDEAQAIKNAATDSARAVRLLKGEHRLALSGTPVENHIGELWSLFEFLNPGLLGSATVFKTATGSARPLEEETRKLLGSALRPFILRRTKDQVAKELPAKTEQTIYCELPAPQRKLYDELRAHYRDGLMRKIEKQGLAKSKIMVLEALLRLRQAACHPGLIDPKRAGEPSAKLEALMEQIAEVRESGHKALVFSQFTSLLKIVRTQLDGDGVIYEYLDGKTKDRQVHVDRFQQDPDCGLFLISLKAGGLGLNLTAADYVFLLDPWWNPAVEAQAVDRAHRIGQTRKVFAYRLIARDTVEEKVLELQKSKRDLAAAIIGEDNALIRNLKAEDLELLLS